MLLEQTNAEIMTGSLCEILFIQAIHKFSLYKHKCVDVPFQLSIDLDSCKLLIAAYRLELVISSS